MTSVFLCPTCGGVAARWADINNDQCGPCAATAARTEPMTTTTPHLGIARMEAATWQPPKVQIRLPRPPRAVWVALAGRVAVVTAAAVMFVGLATFARPEPGRAYDPRGAGFSWSAYDPDTGAPVPRAEWVARALDA